MHSVRGRCRQHALGARKMQPLALFGHRRSNKLQV
uniref:Uncharacterized protein n=1 Tax=Cucumis melo TaxID=3656 RepID=A0A9I9E9F6_CUCME